MRLTARRFPAELDRLVRRGLAMLLRVLGRVYAPTVEATAIGLAPARVVIVSVSLCADEPDTAKTDESMCGDPVGELFATHGDVFAYGDEARSVRDRLFRRLAGLRHGRRSDSAHCRRQALRTHRVLGGPLPKRRCERGRRQRVHRYRSAPIARGCGGRG